MAFEDTFTTMPLEVDGDELNKICSENFIINPHLWEDVNEINSIISASNFREVKYMREDLTSYDEDVNTLPDNQGGLYFFYVKLPILFDAISYLVYIGRAKNTDKQNIRKRCREYFYDFDSEKSTKRIRKVRGMIRHWGEYLYLKYIPLDDNEQIKSLESLLINNIRPPLNDSVPKKIHIGNEEEVQWRVES